jgi:hypothetical protein
MVDHDDDIDDTEANCLVPDPFITALELCRISSSPKTIAAALKKLRKLGRDIDAAEQKLAALTAQAEQKQTEFAARVAALDEREAAIIERETAFESSVQEAHDHLRGFHDNIAEADRHIRYRILSSADLLHGYNERLQDLPTWQQIKQMVPGLPDDVPAAPSAEVITSEVTSDWAGNVFVPGSSLTRTVRGAA